VGFSGYVAGIQVSEHLSDIVSFVSLIDSQYSACI